jgi:hypothetical protein
MTATASASAAASAIYNQHATAFGNVSAYVVMQGAERVATIAFKYPRDGARRLYSYVHWIGTPMVRGFAAGNGYDKHTAACAAAARKMTPPEMRFDGAAFGAGHNFHVFQTALAKDDGHDWNRQLRDAGFNVFQAV